MKYEKFYTLGDWRRLELTRLKVIIPEESSVEFECISRGALVLCYSHWEGYFNDLTEELFSSISKHDLALRSMSPGFRCLYLRAEMSRLIGSRINDDSIIDFLNAYCRVGGAATDPYLELVKSRSSLSWTRLKIVFDIYGLASLQLERERVFIDHRLSRIRHEIAHGNAPRLNRAMVVDQIDKTLSLLDYLVEYFYEVRKTLIG
ncbi:MAG: MAE_28990/MAE_18760 family HEPN-like nuclease [Pseudomonadota bacterium]